MILKQLNKLTEIDTCFIDRKEMVDYVTSMQSILEANGNE